LEQSIVEKFTRDGYVILPEFYDMQQIMEVRAGIQLIVRLLAKK